jgi:hypothetical protein
MSMGKQQGVSRSVLVKPLGNVLQRGIVPLAEQDIVRVCIHESILTMVVHRLGPTRLGDETPMLLGNPPYGTFRHVLFFHGLPRIVWFPLFGEKAFQGRF